MNTDREPAAIAYQLATEARALRDRTTKPADYRALADVRDVTEGLHLTAEQVATVLEQLGAALAALDEQQPLRPAGVASSEDAVSGVLRGLLCAREGLAVVRQELRAAVGSLARMEAQRGERAVL
jgi:hypothetical protein